MWFTLISSLFSFLGGPVAKALVEGYQAKLAAGNTSERIAADLAGKEIGAQQAEMQAVTQLKIAEIGHPFEVEKLFAYITLIYYAKLIIWDKVLGLGVTDPLTGWVLWAANLIIGFYFTKRGFENVARIIKR
jgi:hypothetical protein